MSRSTHGKQPLRHPPNSPGEDFEDYLANNHRPVECQIPTPFEVYPYLNHFTRTYTNREYRPAGCRTPPLDEVGWTMLQLVREWMCSHTKPDEEQVQIGWHDAKIEHAEDTIKWVGEYALRGRLELRTGKTEKEDSDAGKVAQT